jgi:arylformamidase
LDISVPIKTGMTIFEGDPPVHVELAFTIAGGSVANISRLDMGAHSGTHVDAPVHFIDGAAGAERIPLDALLGPAFVVDARGLDRNIRREDLERLAIPAAETRLLFKTPNSRLWDLEGFSSDFIGFDESGAAALVERGARLVGIDYLSVAPFGNPTPTHRAFLEAGAVILEGLDLRDVEPGPYELVCLPLRIVGGDGAPARALLRPRSGGQP